MTNKLNMQAAANIQNLFSLLLQGPFGTFQYGACTFAPWQCYLICICIAFQLSFFCCKLFVRKSEPLIQLIRYNFCHYKCRLSV